MIDVYTAYFIFVFCIVGSSIACWIYGKREGVIDAIHYFDSIGVISLEEEEDD